MRSFVLLAALVALLATASLADAACKKGKNGCIQCKNNKCIKCKPYSVTEDQDSNITVSPAWMLKKDGTCVKCTGKGAELDCLECNPNKPSMCTKCEEREDGMEWALYLTKQGECKVCPGATKECFRCASISGRCLTCYDNKKWKTSGTKCVKK